MDMTDTVKSADSGVGLLNMMAETDSKRPRRVRSRWRGLAYVVVVLVGILGLAAIAGETYESLSRARDERLFPRWGELVDVGGYRLNLNCIGEGSPTVVLDSALGMPGAEWSLVQPEVAEFAHVCSYDRAGYGWSDPGPAPRTAAQNSKELHTLLQNSGVNPPFILVGHGLGGLNARMYARAYAAQVGGIILVDADHEDELQHLPPEFSSSDQQQAKSLHRWQPFMPLLAHLGVARLTLLKQPYPDLSADVTEELRFLQLRGSYFDAMVGELDALPETRNQVRASGRLGDIPLIVLTAGSPDRDLRPEHDRAAFRKTWLQLQASLTDLSSRGGQVIVPESGHLIPLEQPQAVVGVIKEAVNQLRNKP
jgi:pimeloyl-ACP methyl ester carboxylesterase